MMTFPTEWKNKIHFPNHQSVSIYWYICVWYVYIFIIHNTYIYIPTESPLIAQGTSYYRRFAQTKPKENTVRKTLGSAEPKMNRNREKQSKSCWWFPPNFNTASHFGHFLAILASCTYWNKFIQFHTHMSLGAIAWWVTQVHLTTYSWKSLIVAPWPPPLAGFNREYDNTSRINLSHSNICL
jgi:hypothetical protein